MDLLLAILDLFNQRYGPHNTYPYKIECTPDIHLRASQLRPKDSVGSGDLDGKMVIPDPEDGHYYVLLNNKLLESKCDLIETLAHELCHLYDYLAFSEHHCIKLLEIDEQPLSISFSLFSEFKAKALGYLCEYDFTCQLLPDFDKNSIFSFKLNAELKRVQHLLYCWDKTAPYHVMRFLSMIYTHKKTSNDPHIERYIVDLMPESAMEMARLYCFFEINFDLPINRIDFVALDVLIKEIFEKYTFII